MPNTPRPHGITQREAAAKVAIAVAATSLWGAVVVAPAAEADAFPLNKAVLVTDIDAAITDIGATGTGRATLRAFSDFNVPLGVVVRVEEGAGDTPAEIAADQDAKVIAGLELLRTADQAVQARPRIVVAPGLDGSNVAKALELLAPRLDAVAYARAIGDTTAEIYAYRQTFTGRELFLIDGDFIRFDEDAKADVVAYGTAYAAAMRAHLDGSVGYHKTISNVPVPGVKGIVRPRSWNLFSADTEMGLINGADVTGLIWMDGFRFWGNRGCSVTADYAFESAVRSGQVLKDTIGRGLFPYVDRPLVGSLPNDVVESINALLRREVRAGRLVGAEVFLSPGNTPDQLAIGKLKIGRRWTPCAPLEELQETSEITDEFYAVNGQLTEA